MAASSADPHVAASLKVRNDVRKAKMLAKQEAMLKEELASIQQEIDDLVCFCFDKSSGSPLLMKALGDASNVAEEYTALSYHRHPSKGCREEVRMDEQEGP